MDRLAANQERVREGVEQLPDNPVDRRSEVQEIHDRKDEMVRDATALEEDLVRMQQSARGENRDVAAG